MYASFENLRVNSDSQRVQLIKDVWLFVCLHTLRIGYNQT